MKLRDNKKAFTLVELIMVIAILSFLMYIFYPSISGLLNKNRDSGRIKVLQDWGAYYESAKASIGVYPSAGITNVWAAGSDKALARAVNSQAVGAGFVSIFDFSGDRNNGFYNTNPLNEFQTFAVANQILGSASDLKALREWEHMAIFTSATATRMVGCVKLFAANETAASDGDGIPDDNDPNGPDGHRNWNRIYVMWDMRLWEQLGDAARTICQDLPNPADL